jgi:hypothetical protein
MRSCILIHRGALGDFVLVLPILSALKAAGYGRRLIITRPEHAALAEALCLCEAGMDCESGLGYQVLAQKDSAADQIKRQFGPVDLLIALISDDGGVFREWAKTRLAKEVHVVFPRPREGLRIPVRRYLAGELRPLHLDFDRPPPDYWKGGQRVLIHPGSGSPRKNFNDAFFTDLFKKFQPADFLLGPVERVPGKSWPGEPVMPASVTALAEILILSRSLVSHDSGVAHLAAYLGVPTLSLFKTTDPAVWQPAGPRILFLCNPEITPDDAARAMDRLFYHQPRPTGALQLKGNPGE